MPYISQLRRVKLDRHEEFTPDTAGELNYTFTKAIIQYIEDHGVNYQTVNDIVGALEGAKLEFYRRVAAPYEDEKIKVNGDVY